MRKENKVLFGFSIVVSIFVPIYVIYKFVYLFQPSLFGTDAVEEAKTAPAGLFVVTGMWSFFFVSAAAVLTSWPRSVFLTLLTRVILLVLFFRGLRNWGPGGLKEKGTRG